MRITTSHQKHWMVSLILAQAMMMTSNFETFYWRFHDLLGLIRAQRWKGNVKNTSKWAAGCMTWAQTAYNFSNMLWLIASHLALGEALISIHMACILALLFVFASPMIYRLGFWAWSERYWSEAHEDYSDWHIACCCLGVSPHHYCQWWQRARQIKRALIRWVGTGWRSYLHCLFLCVNRFGFIYWGNPCLWEMGPGN